MMHFIRVLLALLFVALCSCSKEGASTSADSNKSSDAKSNNGFSDLVKFKDKPPSDLLADEKIGSLIRSLVPRSEFKCLTDAMEWMPDISANTNGSIGESQTGSHADNFRKTYLSITPSGRVDLVLVCETDASGAAEHKYQYYSNSDIKLPAYKGVVEWLYGVGDDHDRVVRSDGKHVVELSFQQFVESLSVNAASERPTTAPTSVRGTWSCKSELLDRSGASTEKLVFGVDGTFSLLGQGSTSTGTFKQEGNQLHAKISRIVQPGQSIDADTKLEFSVQSSTPDQLQLESTLVRTGTVRRHVCIPSKQVEAQVSQAAEALKRVQPPATVDRVAVYANNLASELERSGMPACSAIAASVRSFGNSSMPAEIRIRQVDATFNRAPDICLR